MMKICLNQMRKMMKMKMTIKKIRSMKKLWYAILMQFHMSVLFKSTPRSELLEEVECAPSPRLALTLKVAGLGTSREVELPLSNYRTTIFCYVQKLLQLSCNGNIKSDKFRRIWEPTY
eukprot:g33230.t1